MSTKRRYYTSSQTEYLAVNIEQKKYFYILKQECPQITVRLQNPIKTITGYNFSTAQIIYQKLFFEDNQSENKRILNKQKKYRDLQGNGQKIKLRYEGDLIFGKQQQIFSQYFQQEVLNKIYENPLNISWHEKLLNKRANIPQLTKKSSQFQIILKIWLINPIDVMYVVKQKLIKTFDTYEQGYLQVQILKSKTSTSKIPFYSQFLNYQNSYQKQYGKNIKLYFQFQVSILHDIKKNYKARSMSFNQFFFQCLLMIFENEYNQFAKMQQAKYLKRLQLLAIKQRIKMDKIFGVNNKDEDQLDLKQFKNTDNQNNFNNQSILQNDIMNKTLNANNNNDKDFVSNIQINIKNIEQQKRKRKEKDKQLWKQKQKQLQKDKQLNGPQIKLKMNKNPKQKIKQNKIEQNKIKQKQKRTQWHPDQSSQAYIQQSSEQQQQQKQQSNIFNNIYIHRSQLRPRFISRINEVMYEQYHYLKKKQYLQKRQQDLNQIQRYNLKYLIRQLNQPQISRKQHNLQQLMSRHNQKYNDYFHQYIQNEEEEYLQNEYNYQKQNDQGDIMISLSSKIKQNNTRIQPFYSYKDYKNNYYQNRFFHKYTNPFQQIFCSPLNKNNHSLQKPNRFNQNQVYQHNTQVQQTIDDNFIVQQPKQPLNQEQINQIRYNLKNSNVNEWDYKDSHKYHKNYKQKFHKINQRTIYKKIQPKKKNFVDQYFNVCDKTIVLLNFDNQQNQQIKKQKQILENKNKNKNKNKKFNQRLVVRVPTRFEQYQNQQKILQDI